MGAGLCTVTEMTASPDTILAMLKYANCGQITENTMGRLQMKSSQGGVLTHYWGRTIAKIMIRV